MKWVTCPNDGNIVALLVVMRRLCGAIVIAVFYSFCAVGAFGHLGYFSCPFRPCARVLSSHLRSKALSANTDILAEQGLGWVIYFRFPGRPVSCSDHFRRFCLGTCGAICCAVVPHALFSSFQVFCSRISFVPDHRSCHASLSRSWSTQRNPSPRQIKESRA